MYDDDEFQPSAPEHLMVHMMVASYFHHHSAAETECMDQKEEFNQRSNRHFHYVLGQMNQLTASPTLSAIQCLAMIVSHACSFKKSSCGLLVCGLVLQRYIELGLHLSDDMSQNQGRSKVMTADDQLRKRAWWTVISIYVPLCGRLGRSMPIGLTDFNVDYPEAICDSILSTDDHEATETTGECMFEAGLAKFKLVPLFITAYTRLCEDASTVATPLDDQLRAWRDALPIHLQPAELIADETRVEVLTLEMLVLELKLALCQYSAPSFRDSTSNTTSTRTLATQDLSNRTLQTALALHRTCGVVNDTTWYQLSQCIETVFVRLGAAYDQRHSLSGNALRTLQSELAAWNKLVDSIVRRGSSASNLGADFASVVVDGVSSMIRAPVTPTAATTQEFPADNGFPQSNPGSSHPTAGFGELFAMVRGRDRETQNAEWGFWNSGL